MLVYLQGFPLSLRNTNSTVKRVLLNAVKQITTRTRATQRRPVSPRVGSKDPTSHAHAQQNGCDFFRNNTHDSRSITAVKLSGIRVVCRATVALCLFRGGHFPPQHRANKHKIPNQIKKTQVDHSQPSHIQQRRWQRTNADCGTAKTNQRLTVRLPHLAQLRLPFGDGPRPKSPNSENSSKLWCQLRPVINVGPN